MGHIKNLPNWANEYQFVVARKVNGNWWFYDATNDFELAGEIARDCNGEVFTDWCKAE